MDVSSVIGWRPVLTAVLLYSVGPYVVLWLAVRCWPKQHARRREWLAEYDAIPTWRRPLWVADLATQSLLNGLEARFTAWRCRRDARPIPDQREVTEIELEMLMVVFGTKLQGEDHFDHVVDGMLAHMPKSAWRLRRRARAANRFLARHPITAE